MRQRWDADRQRWVDDDGTGGPAAGGVPGAPGAGPVRGGEGDGSGGSAGGDPQQQWWASAQTQSALTPPQLPPPPPPQPHARPQPHPPHQEPQSWGAPVVPGGGPPPSRPDPAKRLLFVIVAVALLAGGVGGGVWALNRDDSSDRAGSDAPQSSVTVTATQGVPSAQGSDVSGGVEGGEPSAESASPTPATSPSPGYSRSVDTVGYTVDVPEGWVRTVDRRKGKPSVVHYTSPGGGGELELFELMEASPADSLFQAENDPSFGFDVKLAGYRVLDRQSGTDWAELSYRYDDVQDGASEVVDHRFEAPDGTAYAIRSIGPEGTDVLTPFRMALSSFCPTGAVCATA